MSHQQRRLIRLAQLATTQQQPGLLPVSPATIWRWVRTRAEFPKPVKIGPQTTVWDLAEIEAFIARQAQGGVR
jgi:predicted DNA-binding transcriptional regulator AlpA